MNLVNEENINKLFNLLNSILKLKKIASPSSSKGVENYLKNKVKSYGNKNPEIHNTFITVLKPNPLYKSLTHKEKFTLGIKCLSFEYFDLKLLGSNIMGHLYKNVTKEEFRTLNKTISTKNIINEWATSDCLTSKFYKFYGLLSKENTKEIANLSKENNLWLRRISCVSFVNRVKFNDKKPNFKGFIDLMFEICENNKVHEERFNQLALGWLLREISVIEYERYKQWMKENISYMTREAVRYSIEKLTPKQKRLILSYFVCENDDKKTNKTNSKKKQE